MAFVYSCCFWFSLRLGGILIGIFSLSHGLGMLIALCIARNRIDQVQDEIGRILSTMKILYMKEYLENVRADPEKFITFGICLTCLYMFLCVMYIYGAYICKNVLMLGYIIAEFLRLVGLSTLVATWLLVLKQNTMDIGLLIGASVASGFFLLGMFYLWVCTASLPVLITEMERDEQAATIATLRQILQENPRPARTDTFLDADTYRDVFTVPRRRLDGDKQPIIPGARVLPYYR